MAAYYDRMYAATGKDFVAEARALATLVRSRTQSAHTLLDVGCGTGAHLEELARLGFLCRGVDADPEMVAIARTRHPDVVVEPGDMRTFSYPQHFDAIVSLFGTLAYARTRERLADTVANFAAHLAPGGVVVAGGFVPGSQFQAGYQDLITIDEPGLKFVRMSLARRVGALGTIDFHYLVGTPAGGIERFFNRHELGLFEEDDYRAAFEASGLTFAPAAFRALAGDRSVYVGTAR